MVRVRCSNGLAANASCCRSCAASIHRSLPDTSSRFFGSGAVFFDLCAVGGGSAAATRVLKSISNAESDRLLSGGCAGLAWTPWRMMRYDRLAASHARDARGHYFAIRDEHSTPSGENRLRSADGRIAYTPELAAMLIYLNRTGFNGLFRVNASGAFTVPPGRYARPRIAGSREARAGRGGAWRRRCVELRWGSFRVDARVRPAPAIFCISNIRRTRRSAARRASRPTRRPVFPLGRSGAPATRRRRACGGVAATSSPATRPRATWRCCTTATGTPARPVCARCTCGAPREINSNAARRGHVMEYVITNAPPAAMVTG